MTKEPIRPRYPAGKDLREGPKAEELAENIPIDVAAPDGNRGLSGEHNATDNARARAMGRPYGGA